MTTLQAEQSATSEAPLKRRRVLISALAVSPARGSEAGIGWNIGSRVAKYHDVTLMCVPGTKEPHRQEIEDYLKQHGPIPGLTMLFVEETFLYKLLDHTTSKLLRPLFYFGYASWQRAALRKVASLHAQQPFDLTHHLNILGYREPGYLWKLPIPFFWGPVAGASNIPWDYFSMLSWRDRFAYSLRNILNEVQKRTHFRARNAAKKAAHVWAIGKDNHRMFTEVFGVDAEMLCEAGGKPQPTLAAVKTYDPQRQPLRLVFSGIQLGRKAVPLILHAMARIGNEFPIHFTSIGSGPEGPKWQELSRSLGIADKVNWIAQLPHGEALAEMARAHVFTFPSLQEASSTVTLEALSLGLPVICHDACGMGFIVNDHCGIKVPMIDPETSIQGIADALRKLHREPGEVTRLSNGALRRSEELSWDYAAEQISIGYDRVLSALGR